MKDFEIAESVIDESSVEIIDEQLQKAVRELDLRREILLARAFYAGYDGVDIHIETSIVTDYRDYSMGFEYEAWKDDPPTVDRWSGDVRRYDFRLLDEDEEQMLLSRIGVGYL